MTHSPIDEGVLGRHFVAIATSTYDDERYPCLPVADEIEELSAWLTAEALKGRRFAPTHDGLAVNPSEDDIRAALKNPARLWTERDAAVVFVTGHGEVAHDTHWLILKDTGGHRLRATALRTADLVGWLRDSQIEHLLLIIDACFAGAVVKDTIGFDDEFPKTWLVLPSATRKGTAQAGALTGAIRAAVAGLRSGIGAKHGVHQPFFEVGVFLDVVREHLSGQDLDPLYRGQSKALHVCLPNPHYTGTDAVDTQPRRHELALPKRDLDTHWAPRARGAAGEDRWLFTGRADLIRELIATVDRSPTRRTDLPRVTLVTGGAGSGKSAVLARLVTLADPDFVTAYPAQVADIPTDLRPGVGDVDVAVLASRKYPHEVLGQISEAIGVVRPEGTRGDADLASRIDACRRVLDARAAAGAWVCVVVDALDEAEDPIGIARMLAQLADSDGLRLLVGVRSLADPADPAAPEAASTRGGSLADTVAGLLSARQLRVDADAWWRPEDLRGYAASVLRHALGSPYRDAKNHDRASVLARVIVGSVGRSFLIARLAATALTQRPDLVDPDDAVWRATLTADVVGAFRADLARLYPDPDQRLGAVELLRAVAFAYGRGLPWGEIWPLVANAVADRHGKYGDRDIADLLSSPISAYLTTDQEDDVTVYRLFHDALREALRTRWRDLLRDETR
jgi:hypothetical protein